MLGHVIDDNGGLVGEWSRTSRAMQVAFWKNSGSKTCNSFSSDLKLKLLDRTVLPQIAWKFSIWPWQKSVAIELENLQCLFVARCMAVPRDHCETIDQYDRRRKRLARNATLKHGSWSVLWAKRCHAWWKHVCRAEARKNLLSKLLRWHDASWLREQRALFVNNTLSEFVQPRNSLRAGNTGTRVVATRPQPRFEESIELAKLVLESSRQSERSNNLVSLTTILQRCNGFLRTIWNG